jgi:Xaa-Pro aminopeptidase
MTTVPDERVHAPISTVELERRWAAVRAAMEAAGLDVLLVQNNNDHMGGYVKWFSDVPAVNGHPSTIVFPRDDAMTLVTMGPIGADRELPPDGDGVLRGVRRVLTTASFASAPYTRTYDAELAATALEPYAEGTIGLVGTSQMSLATGEHLHTRLPHAEFAEASDLVDEIKAIKSAEERERIRQTGALQDAAMDAAFKAVEPGRRESDITAVAQQVNQELGSEQGAYLSASWPPGAPVLVAPRHHQSRVLREGDVLMLLIESNGPGGYYAELGRTCVLGPAPPELVEELEFTLEAQRHCLDLMRPSAEPADVFEAYNAFLRDNGRPEEQRLHAHGQGYDVVERPLIRFDETMPLRAHMNLVCHPTWIRGGVASWISDNVLLGEDGGAEPIHRFPQRIVEL